MESDNHNNGQTPSVVNVVRNKEETANIVISFSKKDNSHRPSYFHHCSFKP